jgi:DNA processing protein
MSGLSRHNPSFSLPTRPWPDVPFEASSTHRILTGEPGFPAVLARMSNPARVLWFRGRLPDPAQPALSIVGARAATAGGCRMAGELAAVAARHGHAVVSGGALGIDAAAHRGALEAGGPTFAVLGCGVDVVYPDRHAALFAEIAATGGLISEYAPGTPPRGGHFPVRNRIVAGLTESVLVVEAKFASGALVTARLAAKLGRRLLAVPGSSGTDGLIAAGQARPIRNAGELVRALAGEAEVEAHPPIPAPFVPLVEWLGRGDAGAAELSRRLALSLPAALALLAEAELWGWVVRRPGGVYGISREAVHAN